MSQAEPRYRLIACEVLLRECALAIAASPAIVDPEFLPKGLHDIGEAGMSSRLQQVIDATDEQLTALVLQAVLANTAWHSFENLLPVGARGSVSGTRAVAYHLLVMLSPYVNEASRPYLDYLRGRYAT